MAQRILPTAAPEQLRFKAKPPTPPANPAGREPMPETKIEVSEVSSDRKIVEADNRTEQVKAAAFAAASFIPWKGSPPEAPLTGTKRTKTPPPPEPEKKNKAPAPPPSQSKVAPPSAKQAGQAPMPPPPIGSMPTRPTPDISQPPGSAKAPAQETPAKAIPMAKAHEAMPPLPKSAPEILVPPLSRANRFTRDEVPNSKSKAVSMIDEMMTKIPKEEDDPLITEVTEEELQAEHHESVEALQQKIEAMKIELADVRIERAALETASPTVNAQADEAGRETRAVAPAAAKGKTISVTVNQQGGQPVTFNLWLEAPIAPEEEEFCVQVEQELLPDRANEESDLQNMDEEIEHARATRIHMILCGGCNKQNVDGVVYCEGCHKMLDVSPEIKQEAENNLKVAVWEANLAMSISWRDNRNDLRGRPTAATDYNRKCKSLLKRALQRKYKTIYEGFTQCEEWREICITGGTVTTAVEARKADEHLAEVKQNAARTLSWSQRVANIAIQDFVPVLSTTGGHISAEGIAVQNRMKARFKGCRPVCPQDHFITYSVFEELKSCSICDGVSYNVGVCPTCDPAYIICKLCAEHSNDDQNSYGRSSYSASSSSSRQSSAAPYNRPGNTWGWRSSTGQPSNSRWHDTADSAWSRSDSGWWYKD